MLSRLLPSTSPRSSQEGGVRDYIAQFMFNRRTGTSAPPTWQMLARSKW
jgi:hypothetical protein